MKRMSYGVMMLWGCEREMDGGADDEEGGGGMWRQQQLGRLKRGRGGGGCSTSERACQKDLPLLRVLVVVGYLEDDGGEGDVQIHHWVGL
jgi:hypothetical protein